MNKILEYMAVGLPVVAYDLVEARVSAGESGVYADPDDPVSFAGKIHDLLERPDVRVAMGLAGQRRLEQELSWERSETVLIQAYARAVAVWNERAASSRGLRKMGST